MSAPTQLPPALLDRAAAPYRRAGLHPWLFARGKLKGDPVFAELLRLGLIPSRAQVLDLGCGQGLLAALLCAAATDDGTGWPDGWAGPPRGVAVRGIDSAARDVRWAGCVASACRECGAPLRFEQGDIRRAELGRPDMVVLLDVLHYLTFEEQWHLLTRVRDALAPDGRLLLRVADAKAGFGFVMSLLVDKVVLAARGSRRLALHYRPLSVWQELLVGLGFSVQMLPMHAGTPFANLLLVGRLDSATSAASIAETPST